MSEPAIAVVAGATGLVGQALVQQLAADGAWREKADPMATFAEKPPHTASRVHESDYAWGDDAWLAERATKQAVAEPMARRSGVPRPRS